MKRYLVTGGLGFIGSAIVKKLLQDDTNIVFVVDDSSNSSWEPEIPHRSLMTQLMDIYDWNSDSEQPRLIVVEGDCAHRSVLSCISHGHFDTVFHLAAKPRVQWCVENPSESTAENFFKSIYIAEACAMGKAKLVFSSTSAVYGNGAEMPTSETTDTNPASPYGLAKLCVEQYLELYEQLYDLDWAALRDFNVYGPGQVGDSPYSTAIAAWCHKVKNKEPMRSDGDGEQTRDMVYVEDVAEANVLIANDHAPANLNRIYNIGTGEGYSNNQILNIFKTRGYENVVNAPERPGDVKHTLADNSRMKEDFNWTPSTNLTDGLKKTFEWWDI